MFIGEHRHNLDEKGRLAVPTKWRPQLAEGAVITKGFDGSLSLYPKMVWEEIAQNLATLPQSDPSSRAYVRQTLAGAYDVELDKLGRINVPLNLREYGNLKKATVLAGLSDHIEVWDDGNWNKYIQSIDQNSEEYTQSLKDLGI